MIVNVLLLVITFLYSWFIIELDKICLENHQSSLIYVQLAVVYHHCLTISSHTTHKNVKYLTITELIGKKKSIKIFNNEIKMKFLYLSIKLKT